MLGAGETTDEHSALPSESFVSSGKETYELNREMWGWKSIAHVFFCFCLLAFIASRPDYVSLQCAYYYILVFMRSLLPSRGQIEPTA